MRFPFQDNKYLRDGSVSFSRKKRSPHTGFVGALDGLGVKLQEPSRNDVPNSSVYFKRKGFFSLNFQAMFDYLTRFRFISIASPG